MPLVSDGASDRPPPRCGPRSTAKSPPPRPWRSDSSGWRSEDSRNHLEARFARQRRHARRPGLVAPDAVHALVEVALLPAPHAGLRGVRAPHDLEGAMAVRRRQHDLGPPDELARGVAVGDQSLKLRAVSGVQVKADVITSHTPTLTRQTADRNLRQVGNTRWPRADTQASFCNFSILTSCPSGMVDPAIFRRSAHWRSACSCGGAAKGTSWMPCCPQVG